MSILAARMRDVRPSETKAMTAKAAALRDTGRSIITLSQGEPDFDTPANIRAAAIAAMDEGHTRYTPVPGIVPLREAIRAKFLRDNDLSYAIDQITVGTGAKQVVFNALFATLDPGDEVLIPTPCWVSYPDMVRLAGGTPVLVPCGREEGFKLTPSALEGSITSRTKWVLLNSPGNPTGAVYRDVELAALGSVLARHPQVWVLSDDIYEKLVYGDIRFATMAWAAPELFHRTLTVNGVSKTNAMTGWRLGYGAGPHDLIKAMNVIQGQTTSHATSIAQHAAIEALSGDQSYVADFVQAFEARRDLMIRRLNAIPGLECVSPDGAFYAFASCSGLIGLTIPGRGCLVTDTDVAMYLLDAVGVAVVPGSGFLASPYIRISFAAGLDELTEACDRIERACAVLVRGDAG